MLKYLAFKINKCYKISKNALLNTLLKKKK